MANQNEFFVKIANKLNPFFFKIETVLAIIAVAGFLLKNVNITLGGIILIISMAPLAMVYFINAFSSPEPETLAIKKFLNKLIYWGSSIGIIGILFRLQEYNGFGQMLLVGCGTLIVATIISLLQNQNMGRKTTIRTLIILTIGISLYFVPQEKLFEYKILHPVEKTTTP